MSIARWKLRISEIRIALPVAHSHVMNRVTRFSSEFQQRVMFGEHLDLASYEGGRRYTLNPPGRAFRSVVWDHYKVS